MKFKAKVKVFNPQNIKWKTMKKGLVTAPYKEGLELSIVSSPCGMHYKCFIGEMNIGVRDCIKDSKELFEGYFI